MFSHSRAVQKESNICWVCDHSWCLWKKRKTWKKCLTGWRKKSVLLFKDGKKHLKQISNFFGLHTQKGNKTKTTRDILKTDFKFSWPTGASGFVWRVWLPLEFSYGTLSHCWACQKANSCMLSAGNHSLVKKQLKRQLMGSKSHPPLLHMHTHTHKTNYNNKTIQNRF